MGLSQANGYVNDIIYGIDRVQDIRDAEVVAQAAESMINRRYFRRPVEEYAEAINVVLRTGSIAPHILQWSNRYTEAELLDFLARLAQYLEERRPWPRPAFVKLDAEQWSSFANAQAIARIDRPMHEIERLLKRSFDDLSLDTGKLPVIILELRSGDVVSLMGSVDPQSTVFTLLQRDPGNPVEVIARFVEYTGFPPEDLTPLAESTPS